MSERHQDDVVLFKNYDSDSPVAAPICLHTAYDLPPGDVPPEAPTRESTEVRALIFTHPANEHGMSADTLQASSAPVPQPLTLSLEQGGLQRMDEESCCIAVDHVRKDIDEVNELKDAELLLCKRKIRALEKTCDLLFAERNKCESDAERAQKQIAVQASYIKASQYLSAQLADANIREATRLQSEHDGVEWLEHVYESGGEIIALRQQVEAYKREAAIWKAEALGRAEANAGRC